MECRVPRYHPRKIDWIPQNGNLFSSQHYDGECSNITLKLLHEAETEILKAAAAVKFAGERWLFDRKCSFIKFSLYPLSAVRIHCQLTVFRKWEQNNGKYCFRFYRSSRPRQIAMPPWKRISTQRTVRARPNYSEWIGKCADIVITYFVASGTD